MRKQGQVGWAIQMPEVFLGSLYQRIDRSSKLAFAATFLLGLVTHLFMFVNKLPNGDDLASVYHNFQMIASGRWFDNPAMALSSYYSMPWVTGLVALFFLACSATLLCSILEVRRSSSVILIAGLLATFPALASFFSYMFYADLYMIALFLGLLAIWLTGRYRWGWALGILPLACCLGSYQAFIGVPVVVCLLSLIQIIMVNRQNGPEIFKLLLRYLAVGVLGVLAYFLILRGLLNYLNIELVDYQGIDNMGTLSLEQIKRLIPKSYNSFWDYYLQGTFFKSPWLIKLAYLVLWIVGGIAGLAAIWRQGIFRKPIALLLIPLFAALPVAFNLVYFMAPKAYLHSLMQPQYALMFVIPLVFFEAAYPIASSKESSKESPIESSSPEAREAEKSSKAKLLFGQGVASVCSWILLIGTSLVIYNSFLTVNINYLSLHLKYEISYATELRILDRMEQQPGYTRETPVLFLGYFPNDQQSLYPLNTQEFIKDMVGVNGNLVHHYHNYKGFYNNYLGVNLVFANDAQTEAIIPIVAAMEMPVWPAAGSVAMVEDVLVVHINSENQDQIKLWNLER